MFSCTEKGKTASINIGVSARNLTLSTYALDVDKGVNGYITITNGNGGYSVTKKNNNISVNLSSTRVTVYSNVVGTHTLQVKDSAGKVVSVSVRVLSPLVVTNFNQSIQKYIGETISYSVTSGNGGYSVSSSNTSVATVSPGYLGTSGVITAKGVGSATITLRDGSGKSVSLNLMVKEKALITNIEYTDKVESGYLGGIYFDTIGSLGEVGVEYGYNYIPTGTSIKTQIIPVNSSSSDKSYASFIVPNCTSSCVIYVRPYIKETGNATRIYKNNGSWYQVNYGTTLLTSAGGGTKIANVGEEDFSEESAEESNVESEEEFTGTGNISNSDENILETDENNYTENEEGVEVNAIGQILMTGIFLAGVGLTAYTCVQDGWLSTNCIIGAGLTIVPVGKVANWAGNLVPKKFVLSFFGNTILGRLATSLGKYVDDIAMLGEKAKILTNVLANTSNISNKISSGHAFSKHILEFKNLGIVTKEQFRSHIERIIKSASNANTKLGNNSRLAFWDDKTGTIIIYDKNSIDFGTAFIPTLGKTYFNNFK